MTNKHEHWLQRVRYTAAEPTSWLSHARTLRQAAEDLWLSGNAHSRNPGSELGATILANWTGPDFVPTETGGSTCDVCFMVFGFALENLAKGIIDARTGLITTVAGDGLPRRGDVLLVDRSGKSVIELNVYYQLAQLRIDRSRASECGMIP